MESIVVTGASGAIGRRVVRQLAADPDVQRIVAIDRTSLTLLPAKTEAHKIDILSAAVTDLVDLFVGARSVVHLAATSGSSADAETTGALARRVFEVATEAKVQHMVVLSSALVYGAKADNPIPILESQPRRPHRPLAYAVAKSELEQDALAWAESVDGSESAGRTLSVLRPTTTLSERGASWVAKALRAATSVRPDQLDPPVQFLHHDDLASAVSLATRRQLDGTYNIAPDGWIGAETFRELAGDPGVRLPIAVSKKVLQTARRYGVGSVPPGIEPYVQHPWVIANDKIREAGWVPAFSNEEAFVLGTPAPPWSMSAKRRQEVALGAASAGLAGAAAIGLAAARRLSR